MANGAVENVDERGGDERDGRNGRAVDRQPTALRLCE